MSDPRADYIEGLRQLAAVLEANPEIQMPISGGISASSALVIRAGDTREDLAAAARAFPCAWAKSTSGDGDQWLDLNGQLAGLHVQLYADREAVCTRRVVGVEDREVEEVVTPAVTRKVTKPVEIVEWDCGPILGKAEATS